MEERSSILYLMCCKKGSDDRCQRVGGLCAVKPIFTSSQPSNLSNYRLVVQLTGETTSTQKRRAGFQVEPYALATNQWSILYSHRSNLHVFSLSVFISAIQFLKSSAGTSRMHVTLLLYVLCMGPCQHVYVDVFSCDCVLVRWNVMWERLWQLHYLGGVSLSGCACFLSLGPLSHSNIYLLPWHNLSSLFSLSVSELRLTVLITQQL